MVECCGVTVAGMARSFVGVEARAHVRRSLSLSSFIRFNPLTNLVVSTLDLGGDGGVALGELFPNLINIRETKDTDLDDEVWVGGLVGRWVSGSVVQWVGGLAGRWVMSSVCRWAT